MRIITWTVRGALLAVVTSILLGAWMITSMPGCSYRGPLAPLSTNETPLSDELRRHVVQLADRIGERSIFELPKLAAAADYIEGQFRTAGYDVERQEYQALRRPSSNLIAELRGRRHPEEVIVVGAHYDTVYQCPGANDNASGVAAVLALARRLHGRPTERTLRFVAFTNEEPPLFQTDNMGSLVYARRCQERGERIVGMLALETMGCFSDAPDSQHYPAPFGLLYPSRGDFIAFVGDFSSRRFLRGVVGAFRRHAQFPSEGAALPRFVEAAGWSDHWSFWQIGVPALMVTDTAPFRYPDYHLPSDTPDKLDYERLARVVAGLEGVLLDLANESASGGE